ncbi:uncharacterized protein LOC124362170 [Homalodisca vitripennis]|uniref:uncharacterized protein LOC124362170 n=1 Tax=Homalodisca vitripennis TaxID=197043 RepID=UPI001EEAE39F|nr:uncharacterized protein LOC124362170 [Homalodisca vitripennis]
MYADDTTLFLTQRSADGLAVSSYTALNMAIQYCYGNDLVVNPSKTNQIAFGRRASEVPTIPDVSIEDHLKFLGVTVDTELNWINHVDNLSKKLNTGHFVIKANSFSQ